MAEAKYDLLLGPSYGDRKIYNQPWYKERLKTKYIKSLGPTETSQFLHGQNWTFVKDGLDDFRDGLPPAADGDMIKGSKGLSPNIKGSSSEGSIKQPAVRHRFNKHEICFSRATPLQQTRREHIEEIEYGLTQHPLALYPHLEECLPPEMFEDVVDILDPEMNLGLEDGDEEYFEDADTESRPPTQPKPRVDDDVASQSEEGRIRNPYRWLPRKEEKDKKDKKKGDRRSSFPSEHEHINSVTKDFCDWVASLGGETNNIEESTITSLFASGYETKPALSVPIHVVELTNVPPELRMSTMPNPQQQQQQSQINSDTEKKTNFPKAWAYGSDYIPSWLKFKYGAWYLDPGSWKKRDADEPLQDPQELKDQEMSEAKKKSTSLDYDLAPMHGAKAFMEFIDKKNSRRPEFLDHVADIQHEQEMEEKKHLEAELAKQRKSQNSRQETSNLK